jgi:hypothetical protein
MVRDIVNLVNPKKYYYIYGYNLWCHFYSIKMKMHTDDQLHQGNILMVSKNVIINNDHKKISSTSKNL